MPRYAVVWYDSVVNKEWLEPECWGDTPNAARRKANEILSSSKEDSWRRFNKPVKIRRIDG